MATSADFTEAPPEVIRYFDAKGQRPSFDWRDVAPHEHAVTFTVARTAGYDVLDDIRAASRDAIANYTDFGTFADRLTPILRAKGWWGRAVLPDPDTGELTDVGLGSLHRLRTIYWANVSTARASGEWERIQRTKDMLPYLEYGQSVAENKRPLHQSWVGTILPVDHDWWHTHYPPNGWLCQCRVRQLTSRAAKAKGYDSEKPAPVVETYKWTNKRTGEVTYVPKGIDPGWQGHPGMRRAENAQQLLAGRLAGMSAEAQASALQDITGSRLFQAIQRNEFGYDPHKGADPRHRPTGHIAAPVAGLTPDTSRLIGLAPDAPPLVQFSVADAAKQMGKGERAHFTADLYAVVQSMLDQGECFRDTHGPATFVFRGPVGGRPFLAVLQLTKDRQMVFLKSFRRTDGKDRIKWEKVR